MISDDTIKKTICKNIVKYRKLAGLSQKEFAAKLGAAPSRVSSWETGANSTDIDTLFKICEILNVSINDMCEIYPDINVTLSYTEQEHIKKYRLLDETGQQHIDDFLNWEIDRSKTISQQNEYISELEKLASINTIPPEPCRSVRFFQTYPSPSTGKVMWDDIKIDNTEIPDNGENNEGDYLITMDDDSMAPLFWRTDILLVKETDKIELGEIGVFTLNGVCYIKELGKNKLISRNPDFPPIMFDNSLECKGKVLRNLMEHTEDEIKYLTERKDHIRRYQETYQMVAENGLNDDDETRKLVQKIVDSLKETPDSND